MEKLTSDAMATGHDRNDCIVMWTDRIEFPCLVLVAVFTTMSSGITHWYREHRRLKHAEEMPSIAAATIRTAFTTHVRNYIKRARDINPQQCLLQTR